MNRLFAVISVVMILSGCTATAPIVPTATATPRPTVTPLGSPIAYAVVTRIVIATETRIPLPSSTNAKTATPTNTPAPKPTLPPAQVPEANPDGLVLNITQGTALQFPRTAHTATRLPDGKILLVGGSRAVDDFLAEVELFDPKTGLSRRVASLHTPRHAHTATLLPDGRVLVVGGYTLPQQWLNDAEVYDPVADTWTVVPPRYSHGSTHTATLMKDGRVLVVGGAIGNGVATERVEIFDPQTNTWTEARPLTSELTYHTAQLLDDGHVLVAGGAVANGATPAGGDAQLYDPRTNTWTATGPMVQPCIFSQSARLPDGRVLVAGGTLLNQSVPPIPILASAEIYNPTSNVWTSAADLSQARYNHVLVPLPDGQVLAVGGARDWDNRWTENSFVREIEIYDPVDNEWRTVGDLPQPGTGATATLLLDGRVWLTGSRYMEKHWSDTWLISDPSRSLP